MKKIGLCLLILVMVLSIAGCGAPTSYNLTFRVPAGSTNDMDHFVCAVEEISPKTNEIIVVGGEGIVGDAYVIVKPICTTDETEYPPCYLICGETTKIPAQKGQWYQIGICMYNSSTAEIEASLLVKDADVRTK